MSLVSGSKPTSEDEWGSLTLLQARAGMFAEAIESYGQLPTERQEADETLIEALALAAAEAGNRAAAWRFLNQLERKHPTSPAIDRLRSSPKFEFQYGFFGAGPKSLQNYAKGFGSGVVGWSVDLVKGLGSILRHPIDSVVGTAKAIAELCRVENLRKLLSPKEMAQSCGAAAAGLWFSAWDSCKRSAAAQYGLDLDRFEDQQSIHEIAAGRMFGYVAPDLALLAVGGGAVAAERVAQAAEATSRAEKALKVVSELGRSEEYFKDLERFKRLGEITWLSDGAWRALKAAPSVANKLESVVEDIHAIRNVPGAQWFVEKRVIARLKGASEGELFHLKRAGHWASKGKLAGIERQFEVVVDLPGKPVSLMSGWADLVLKDETLVEVKYRSIPLALDEAFQKQLLKYRRAVQEGQFKKVLIECSTGVSRSVKERCSTLFGSSIPYEIVESVAAAG